MYSILRHSSIRNLGAIATVVTSLIACSPQRLGTNNGDTMVGLFANRPVPVAPNVYSMPDLYVVTLTEPPLLTVSTKTKTGWVVPAAAKAKLLAEQARVEAKIKQLAPDAQIVYRYHLTVNGFAVFSTTDLATVLAGQSDIKVAAPSEQMARPQAVRTADAGPQSGVNSVNFIGADAAHKMGYTGKGVRVGVIDTGIDYTHAMLGGSGNAADYKAINPALPNPAFPNNKVVGGADFVGTNFNAASPDASAHLPKPDANPLDEAGHGSHVAGTIAGHGDGITTYDGVAPDAQLYALKVFGKEGSTADASVIAAFEFAADPNGDLNPDDQLDVVNLSLGGDFGSPHVLYTEAVKNLSNSGTVVVAAAGNAGDVDYIVGAPGTSTEALSVAASVDGSDVNWRFPAALISSQKNPSLLVKVIEGNISLPAAKSGNVAGPLVDIGDGSQDLTPAVKAQLAGKVALIVRGGKDAAGQGITFVAKLQRAVDAGAIGALVYNNVPGDPIPMGGEIKQPFSIPAIMVTQEIGLDLLAQVQSGATVTIQFNTGKVIEDPALIDTITSFSSRGPRSEDNLIKPEISAPGQNITSVAMGTGTGGVKMDGTSMATPHMTGVMALLKQRFPGQSSQALKSLAMNSSKILGNVSDGAVPIVAQGAGRVQIDKALALNVITDTPGISLGRVQLESTKTESRQIVLRNLTSQAATYKISSAIATPGLSISVPSQVTIPANGSSTIVAQFSYDLTGAKSFTAELDGRILVSSGSETVMQIPVLAIRTQESNVSAAQTATGLRLVNTSPVIGPALAFNLLGQDLPKPLPDAMEKWMGRGCDLQSVGYRLLEAADQSGRTQAVLQVAFKIYKPVTTWIGCSVTALIDTDGDGVADQELTGVTGQPLDGVTGVNFQTVLLDSKIARNIRLNYQTAAAADPKAKTPDYTPALIGKGPMTTFDQSTLAVIEVPVAALGQGKDGKLHLKMVSSGDGETFESDKFLGTKDGSWYTISPKIEDQPYYGMDEVTVVKGSAASTATINRGSSKGYLVLYYPFNSLTSKVSGVQFQVF